VTVAQALHWFDAPSFFAEACRVLAPSGALAAWCYGLPVVERPGHPGNDAMLAVYSDLTPWWDARRRLVEGMYQGARARGRGGGQEAPAYPPAGAGPLGQANELARAAHSAHRRAPPAPRPLPGPARQT
jgi:hypothetical protein